MPAAAHRRAAIAKALRLAAALAIAASFSSCSRDDALKPRIGVVMKSFEDPLCAASRGAMEAAAAGRAELSFADSRGQAAMQARNVESFISQKVGAIAIDPVDALSARSAISGAKAKGIPLVIFGGLPAEDSMRSWDKVFYVGASDAEAGEILGGLLADFWKATPSADANRDGAMQLVVIAGEAGLPETYVRVDHVVKALAAARVRSDKLLEESAGGSRATAKEKTAAALVKFPGRIEAIACTDEEAALGAIDACEAAGALKGKKRAAIVGVYGPGPSVAMDEALASGKLLGVARFDADSIGGSALSLSLALAKGVEPSKAGLRLQDAKYVWVPYRKVKAKVASAAKK